jgi:hypothetical protein
MSNDGSLNRPNNAHNVGYGRFHFHPSDATDFAAQAF